MRPGDSTFPRHGSAPAQIFSPRMESISYEVIVDTDEPDHRLELLHDNVKKFGTVFNTVAPGTALSGVLRRKEAQT